MDRRPDPDELLARVRIEEAEARRGPAKGLLRRRRPRRKDLRHARGGADPEGRGRRRGRRMGVGDARPARDGRTPGGQEILPPRILSYRGRELKEFDLDAALERRPAPDPRRRARPHQCARLAPRQAVAGRPGNSSPPALACIPP